MNKPDINNTKDEEFSKKLKLRTLHKDVLKGFFVSIYLIQRATLPLSSLLDQIYIDKIMLYSGFLLFFAMFVVAGFINYKIYRNPTLYSSSDNRYFARIEFQAYEPYDYEKRPKPIMTLKKVLLYMLYTELAISSFFLIDLIFGL